MPYVRYPSRIEYNYNQSWEDTTNTCLMQNRSATSYNLNSVTPFQNRRNLGLRTTLCHFKVVVRSISKSELLSRFECRNPWTTWLQFPLDLRSKVISFRSMQRGSPRTQRVQATKWQKLGQEFNIELLGFLLLLSLYYSDHIEPLKVEDKGIPDLPILTCCKLDQFSQIFLHTRTDGMIFYHKMTFPLLYGKKKIQPQMTVYFSQTCGLL